MTTSVTAQNARNNFAEMLNTAVYGRTNIVITRFNKPQAVLLDYQEYERLINPRLRFSDEEWEKGFKVIDRIRAKTKRITSQKAESLIDKTVEEVRSIKRVSGRN